MNLRVSEIFGPTFQGEGPSAGRLASFLRLGGCNLDCVWCDTPYTWDWERFDRDKEVTEFHVEQVAEQVKKLEGMLVITGGEPAIQERGIVELLTMIQPRRIEIESNATRVMKSLLDDQLTFFNLSPKLANSGIVYEKRIRPAVLSEYADHNRAIFKFVCEGSSDLEEVQTIVEAIGIDPDKVWIMPEGTTTESILAHASVLADRVLEFGYNFTLRSHVLLWGSERGH